MPASFLTLDLGTPVVDRFGRPVGKVERVLVHDHGEFDGLIVSTRAGRRFVDAPEVRRIAGGAVTLGVAVDEVERPDESAKRLHGVPPARYGRTHVTEADRDAVIDRLKRAYCEDDCLTVEQLGERVGLAHLASTLDQLDSALRGLAD